MKNFAFASWFCLLMVLPVAAQTKQPRNPLGDGEAFGGIRTFLHAPYINDIEKLDADVVVVGVPFDEGTTARPGARYGPRDIREGSLIYAWARGSGFFYITSEQIHRNGIQPALTAIPQSENIYVTFDIDVLDPALALGTGTVEVGGLTFRQLSDMLRAIPSKGHLVGMDVVEVNSYYDPTGVTAQTAARLIIDLGAALPSKVVGSPGTGIRSKGMNHSDSTALAQPAEKIIDITTLPRWAPLRRGAISPSS